MNGIITKAAPRILVVLLGGLGFLASCSLGPAQAQDASARKEVVVLSIVDLTGGAINGTARCTDEAGRMLMKNECMPSEKALIEAVFACGPKIATIDLSWTHAKYVSFPTDWRPGSPSNLEVVRCVQSKVGFAFSAMISTDTKQDERPDGNDTAFLSLHTTHH